MRESYLFKREYNTALSTVLKLPVVYINITIFSMPLVRITCLLILMSFFISGCAIFRVQEQVRETKISTVLVGQISSLGRTQGPIVVLAYSKENGERRVAHHVILHDCGEFELMVPKGTYHVFAFNDSNRNLVYDQEEIAGQFGESGTVRAPAGGVVSGIDILLLPPKSRVDWPYGEAVTSEKPVKFYSRLAGVTTTLDDERFSTEYGNLGFWEPVTFYRELGGTIYFLEEYDPEKIPVLFIHGAGATPKDWQYFVENLDKERFQPWFFYYPSGARMRSMANLLSWKLKNLHARYRFKSLYITAHSMGGLVGRSFIMDFWEEFPYVKIFVSLATPWGGDKMAEYGVQQSPGVIPCWIDMQPSGDFIRSLFRREMPKEVGFYLFYGFRGDRNPFFSNNDGTITLSSLLDSRAQAEARMSYAFDVDHGGILESDLVVEQYNSIINAAFSEEKAVEVTSNGYLVIDLSYSSQATDTHPWPKLILKAAEEENVEIEVTLRPQDSGKKLGPFPRGRYYASLSTEGFKTDKKWVVADIEYKKTERLAFTLSPDGMITGYITQAIKPSDKVLGMPGWENRPLENNVPLRSVTLSGGGKERILLPADKEKFNYREMEVSRSDYCYNGYFRFFGLPAGVYTLKIQTTKGSMIESTHRVIPGKEQPIRFYELPDDMR